MGQTADLIDLQRILLRQRPPLSNAAQQTTSRWAVWAAAMVLRRYKAEHEALQVGGWVECAHLGGWLGGGGALWGGWGGGGGPGWGGGGQARGCVRVSLNRVSVGVNRTLGGVDAPCMRRPQAGGLWMWPAV